MSVTRRTNPSDRARTVRPCAILAALTVLGTLAIPNSVFAQPGGSSGMNQNADLTPETRARIDGVIDTIFEAEAEMRVPLRRSKLIRTKLDIRRAAVADPAIIEFVAFGTKEIELIGKQTGSTSVTLWLGDPAAPEILSFLVHVVRDTLVNERRRLEYGEFEAALNEMFPDSKIQLFPIADKVIVKGQARDAEEVTRIMSVIRGGGNSPNPYGGDVTNQGLAAEPFPQGSQLPPSSVISMITVPGEQQVMLKVRIAELKRNAVRQMGVSFDVDIGDFFLASMLGGAGNALINGTFDEGNFNLILGMLEQHGVAKILAQPNLVTLSGKTATFIAGGQFAVPTVVGVGGAQAATTSFQGFGTQLTFTPTVLDKDRIRLQVSPQFSTINAQNSVNGIFGIDTRGVSTVVDLREGQVLAIAGLIQEQQSGARSRLPYLGALPGLGLLFSDKNSSTEETELVMIVSPEIVHAMEPEEAPSLLPGMELTEPTDYDFFMRSQIEGRPNCNHRSTVWPKYRDQLVNPRLYLSNYFNTENFYVQGPHGLSN